MRGFLKQDVRVTPCLPRRSHRFCRSCERRDRIADPADQCEKASCSASAKTLNQNVWRRVCHAERRSTRRTRSNCRALINAQCFSDDLSDLAKMMWSAKRAPAPRLPSNFMFSSRGAKAVVQASKNSGFLSSSILCALAWPAEARVETFEGKVEEGDDAMAANVLRPKVPAAQAEWPARRFALYSPSLNQIPSAA